MARHSVFLISAFLITALAVAAPADGRTPASAPTPPGVLITIEARPIVLDPQQPARRTFGRLRFKAGFALRGTSTAFGGFSGLAVSADGRHLTAVSDRGHWLSAELHHDATGTLSGLGTARLGPLHNMDGKPVAEREWRDAEELVALADGTLAVTFEGVHRIWHYSTPGQTLRFPHGLPRPLPNPAGLAAAHHNGGLEAVTQLADGQLLLLTENLRGARGHISGWLGPPDGKGWQRLGLVPTGDFQPTGLTTLSDGDLILLERSYSAEAGTWVRLSRLDAAQVRAGAALVGEELARFGPPLAIDNMEAVAARPGPDGTTLLYLLSDDNFSPTQRTLLIELALTR